MSSCDLFSILLMRSWEGWLKKSCDEEDEEEGRNGRLTVLKRRLLAGTLESNASFHLVSVSFVMDICMLSYLHIKSEISLA